MTLFLLLIKKVSIKLFLKILVLEHIYLLFIAITTKSLKNIRD